MKTVFLIADRDRSYLQKTLEDGIIYFDCFLEVKKSYKRLSLVLLLLSASSIFSFTFFLLLLAR
jgi:hypothetical protein